MQSKKETMSYSDRWSCKFFLGIFLLAGHFQIGLMFPNGAPLNACDKMDPSITPNHDGGKQDGGVPFRLKINEEAVTGGETVTLQIEKKQGAFGDDDFKGFMVQGFRHGSNEIIGEFKVKENDPNVKTMNCNGAQSSSVTHVSREPKSTVNLTWMSPKLEDETAVQFFFTVVANQRKFWVKQEAEKIVKVKVYSPDSSAEPESEGEPESEVEPESEGELELRGDLESEGTSTEPQSEPKQEDNNSVYAGCSDGTKGCFGSSINCLKSNNCKMMTAYSFDDEARQLNIQLAMRGMKNSEYVAMGLSFDGSMGDDLVFVCTQATDPVSVGYNDNKNGPAAQRPNITVSEKSFSNENGVFVCSFSVDERMTFTKPGTSDEVTFDVAEKLFILLARGDTAGDKVTYHVEKVPSSDSIDLKSTSAVSAAASLDYLLQVHGALMVFAWVAMAATGMVMARYYKQTWKSVRPFRKDLWFTVHRILMSLVVITSITAFIIACIVKGFLPYSPKEIVNNPHPATGFATILCACAQPIMAYFRPHPDTSKRWIFDWLHWFVGNAAYFLGICTLFLAVDLPAAKLNGKNVEIALIVYVVGHVITHLVLTFQHCKGTKNVDVNDKDAGRDDSHKDMKGSLFRKIVALIYFVFVWIVAISVVIIIYQKSEEFYGNEDEPDAEAEGASSEPEAEG